MLIFCNNFFSVKYTKFLVTTKTNDCFILIQKNGTTSFRELARAKPKLFKIVSVDYLIEHHIDTVTVFVRDPIERVLSGLTTQMKLFNISKTMLETLLNLDETFNIYDSHTIPQFWFLLSLSNIINVKFQIKALAELDSVDTDIKNMNQNHTQTFNLTNPAILERLTHFYTEDIVLYQQFLNTVCDIDMIIKQIKLEKDFVSDLQQYRQALTYLL